EGARIPIAAKKFATPLRQTCKPALRRWAILVAATSSGMLGGRGDATRRREISRTSPRDGEYFEGWEEVRFVLSPEERLLVLKHGYPFEELEALLKAANDRNEPVDVELDQFWFEHLLGELARSINHASSPALASRLDDLYEYLVDEAQ